MQSEAALEEEEEMSWLCGLIAVAIILLAIAGLFVLMIGIWAIIFLRFMFNLVFGRKNDKAKR
jgi:membrane protein implicated in regulation of membrane protease activity